MKKLSIVTLAVACAGFVHAANCKMPTCKEPAMEKSQFCERHTCHTEGCYNGVKIGGIPGWAAGKANKSAPWMQGGATAPEVPTKIVWKHCPKHACGRVMPRIKNDTTRNLLVGKNPDEILCIMACDRDRLYKGKYCLKHSCGMAKCPGCVLEEWSEAARDNEKKLELADLTTNEFCPRHLSLKGDNKFEREGPTKETCSEYFIRIKEEKAAKAAKAAEKAAAKAAEKTAKAETTE